MFLMFSAYLSYNSIGVNISERKSGTQWTKKRELGCCPSYDNPGYLYHGPYAVRTKSQLKKQSKHTTFYKFEEVISFAEHWKLVAGSSEFHLMLKRAHRVHFFQLEIRQKSGTF